MYPTFALRAICAGAIATARRSLPLLVLGALCLPAARSGPVEAPAAARMSFLDNRQVKVGVDLSLGGAITWLSRAGGENLVNSFDLGRQIQLSYYSGPVPFASGGQKPAEQWKHLGWNPIQAGDDFRHGSRVVAQRNDGRALYVKCVPLQWPLNGIEAECTFESWLELEGPVVKARARLVNARADSTQYPARLQELPALYANAPFHRVVSYTGRRPGTGERVEVIPRSVTKHPWSFWLGTEHWSALLDAEDRGLGLITPGRIHFTGGFAGQPGPNDALGSSTGYLAGQALEILDHHLVHEFAYELLPGSLAEIRARGVAALRSELPGWTFARDRQGWSYRHAGDTGWPIAGMLEVPLREADPQLHSPLVLWSAESAPFVVLEAAFHTRERAATLYWRHHGEAGPGPGDSMSFPIEGDGQFHRYAVRLAEAGTYAGALVQLRFDPVPAGAEGDWMKLKSITLARARE